ncbi:MAG: glycosyltransferase [Deltaproteobacteria bacterium]|nr:glycosyltransferase [Deltaproteobacteria bacterium]
MRIAFLISSFPALSETFILNQITGLLDLGHEVDIFPSRRGDIESAHKEVDNYSLLDHTHYIPDPPQKLLPRIIDALGLMFRHFFKNPLALTRSLFRNRAEGRLGRLSLLYGATPFIGRREYDVIHCHYGKNGLRGSFYREIGAIRGKLLVTFHGYDITEYMQRYGPHVYDRLFEKADLFLPISDNWKRRLIEKGCPTEKIQTHRMGIDCEKFRFAPRRSPDRGPVRLITIARLVEKKGVEYGIRAIAEMLKRRRDIEYLIVGDGPLRPILENLILNLNVNGAVKLIGWKSQEELLDILKDSHIMLTPSVTGDGGDQEGIPVVLMEAMAMGLPIITTIHSGIPELVQDGKSGFLVPERDVKSLVEKISYLLDNSEGWSKMGTTGRAFVDEHYNIKTLNDTLVTIFEKVELQALRRQNGDEKSLTGYL